jgi:leishmanolysin-like peptidase
VFDGEGLYPPIYIPSQYLGADTLYGPSGSVSGTLPAGAGLDSADYGLFITAQQTAVCGDASGGVVAYALGCQRDALDRPTWGRINLCPASISTAAAAYHTQVSVVMHEMAHALGFSSDSWPLFRNADGSPRTPRDPNDPASVARSNIM